MENIFDMLQSQNIIDDAQIIKIKNDIKEKYPYATSRDRARMLSKAIYQLVDENIVPLDSASKLQLRKHLIVQALERKTFDISTLDVVVGAQTLNQSDAFFVDTLTQWTSNCVGELLEPEQVISLLPSKSVPVAPTPVIVERQVAEPIFAAVASSTKGATSRSYETFESTFDNSYASTNDAAYDLAFDSELYSEISVSGTNEEQMPRLMSPDELNELLQTLNLSVPVVEQPYTPIEEKSTVRLQIETIINDLVHFVDELFGFAKANGTKVSAVILLLILTMIFVPKLDFSSDSTTSTDSTIVDLGTTEIPLASVTSALPSEYGLRAIAEGYTNNLPLMYRYKEIDQVALAQWLSTTRSALIAESPYFEAIIETAKEYDIHPLLLFAITGQEQAFVPKGSEFALEIINNPFNVFGSWKDYNTSTRESAVIAARTLLSLSVDCPPTEDVIAWINKTYAEDPNWHKGVTQIFNQLTSVSSYKQDK